MFSRVKRWSFTAKYLLKQYSCPVWEEDVIDDLVDIVCSNEMWKHKLIYENTKKSANEVIYTAILVELNARLVQRDMAPLHVTVQQTQTRFKKCMSISKEAALTIKTKSGITRLWKLGPRLFSIPYTNHFIRWDCIKPTFLFEATWDELWRIMTHRIRIKFDAT